MPKLFIGHIGVHHLKYPLAKLIREKKHPSGEEQTISVSLHTQNEPHRPTQQFLPSSQVFCSVIAALIEVTTCIVALFCFASARTWIYYQQVVSAQMFANWEVAYQGESSLCHDSPSKFLISRQAEDDGRERRTDRQPSWLYSQQRCTAVWPLRSKAAGSAPPCNNSCTILTFWVITAR